MGGGKTPPRTYIMIIDQIDKYSYKSARRFKKEAVTNCDMLHILLDEHFGWQDNGNGFSINGIEVGVHTATLDIYLLKNVPYVEKMTGIDPMTSTMTQSAEAAFNTHFRFIQKKSNDAVNDLMDGSAAFVFVDGEHSYQQVKDDMINYLPKVQKGGLLIGHDYVEGWKEVKQAVEEVADDWQRDVFLGADGVWWVYV